MLNDSLTAKVTRLVADYGVAAVLTTLELEADKQTQRDQNISHVEHGAWVRIARHLHDATGAARVAMLPAPEYYGIYASNGDLMGCCTVEMLDHERTQEPTAEFRPITKEQFDKAAT